MNNTLDIKESSFGINIFINYLFLSYTFFQLAGILRAATIYNTLYLANLSNVAISLFVITLFMLDIKNIRFKAVEIILLFYPLLHIFYGILINGLNRNTLSHLFTSVSFAILVIFMRNSNFKFMKNLQLRFANWMFWGLVTSIVSYQIAPLIGIRIYSVGVISIFSLFPLIVFFFNKKRRKFLITIVMLILGGKRGVLLSGLLAFVIVGLGHKRIKKSIRITVLLISSVFIFSLFYISTTPLRISQLPNTVQPMFARMMYTNPFSHYNRIESDPRVREVKGAMKPLIEHPIFILTGRGGGYSYDYLDVNGFIENERHNTHFSPVAILSRFGIIYTFILYSFIISIIYNNFRKMKQNKLSLELTILLIYVISSFFNSFTAFTIYSDYLFILSLGLLNYSIPLETSS